MTTQERTTLKRLTRRAMDADVNAGIHIGNQSFEAYSTTPRRAIDAGWCVLLRLFINGSTDDHGRRLYSKRRRPPTRRLAACS